MNEERYINLLTNLIGESKFLQNSPSQNLHPREDLASDHVLKVLEPFSTKFGGPLEIQVNPSLMTFITYHISMSFISYCVQRISFIEGRGNVIIKYPGTTDKVCSFIGSHLDVVTANAEDGWEHDPFKLTIVGDSLFGRGTTDCLGHVALLTDFMASLAERKYYNYKYLYST